MPGRASPPLAGGRGGRVSSPGVRGAGREPMPWLGANGLLPGRGAPGRPTGRGGGVADLAAGAAGASGSAAGASGSAAGASGSATGALGPGLGPGLAAGAACSTGASAGASAGVSAGASVAAGAAAGLGPGFGAGLQLVAVLLLEAHLDGGLDSRRSRLDELTHLLELFENELALDSELLGEFVDSGLCHGCLLLLLVRDPEGEGNGTASGCAHSLRVTHRVLMSCVLQFLVGAAVIRTGRSGGRGSPPPVPRRALTPSEAPGEMLGGALRAANTPAWGADAPHDRVPGDPDRAPGLVGPRHPSLQPRAATRSPWPWHDNPRTSGRVRAQVCQSWWPLLTTLLRGASGLRTGNSELHGHAALRAAASVHP